MKKSFTPSENYLQNGIYLILLILVAVISWPLAPTPSPEAHGILLPNISSTFTPISSKEVSAQNTVPITGTLIGNINTEIHYSGTTLQNDTQNLNKSLILAKDLAAKAGANVLVISRIGRTIAAGPLDSFVVEAEAYHVGS